MTKDTFLKTKTTDKCLGNNTESPFKTTNKEAAVKQKEVTTLAKTSVNVSPPKHKTGTSLHLQREGTTIEANLTVLRDVSEEPLHITMPPPSYCLPEEILTHQPKDNEIFRIFFKGTPKEVRIRQIFYHTPITDIEQRWLQQFRCFCTSKRFLLDPSLDSYLLRLCYFTFRKYGKKDYLEKALELLVNFVNWRTIYLPLSDTEPDILESLSKGIAYWVARDTCLRPLLVLRLVRLAPTVTPQQFKRLIIFCFEWAIRYLMVPGLVETCLVMVDTRGVALHRYPVSALIDMTDMLTRQYPFRLHCMFVISQSIFVQILWNAVKPFLTELQQEKIQFNRACHDLLLNVSPLHLEKSCGGVREEITTFYPFPLLPGPFHLEATALNYQSEKDCWKLTSRETCKGVVWENDITTPVQWVTPPKCNLSKDQVHFEDKSHSSRPNRELEQQQKPLSDLLKETIHIKHQESEFLDDHKRPSEQITLPSHQVHHEENDTAQFNRSTRKYKLLQGYQLPHPKEPLTNLILPTQLDLESTCHLNSRNSTSVIFEETKEPSLNHPFNIIRHIKTCLFPFRLRCYSKDQTRY